MSRRRVLSLAVLLATALIAAAFCIVSRPVVALDDAAITFRYVERLATGKGLTYNDHEWVLGASNPLYAVVLSGPIRLGVAPERAAMFVGGVSYVVCVVLVGLVAGIAAGRSGFCFAAFLLMSDVFFRFQVLGGLEVGFAAAIGLGSALALLSDRPALAGTLSGLALVTKLDAIALVLAVVIGGAIRENRTPFRCLTGLLIGFGPWLVVSTFLYGSPVPQSLLTKLSGGEEIPYDAFWAIRFLLEPPRSLVATLAATAMVSAFMRTGTEGQPAKLLAAWLAFHVLGYSVVNLGAPYPWYLAVPLVPLYGLAGIAAGRAAQLLRRNDRRYVLTGLTGCLGLAALAQASAALPAAWTARKIQPWEAFELDRRAAGVFLRNHALHSEVLECAYGWPAFESRLATNDMSGLNSRKVLLPVSYRVEHGQPFDRGGHAPSQPSGMVPLAKFDTASRLFPGYSWFVVYGRPESHIARSMRRQLGSTAPP